MFTGIIEAAGEIESVADDASGRRLTVRAGGIDDLHYGQSIAVSGVCLTVERFGDESTDEPWFEVFLASETVEKTYLGAVERGDVVNIERAMPATGRFDGHVVQGHVDTTAEIVSIDPIGDDWRFTFTLPDGYAGYVVEKGSICLDGISLTVAAIDRDAATFDVAIIPTTYDLTTLRTKSVGDRVHVEVDVIAKYVENMLEGYV
ncbi:MAG: riboflavin synthase [Halobacteriota archaeon]